MSSTTAPLGAAVFRLSHSLLVHGRLACRTSGCMAWGPCRHSTGPRCAGENKGSAPGVMHRWVAISDLCTCPPVMLHCVFFVSFACGSDGMSSYDMGGLLYHGSVYSGILACGACMLVRRPIPGVGFQPGVLPRSRHMLSFLLPCTLLPACFSAPAV